MVAQSGDYLAQGAKNQICTLDSQRYIAATIYASFHSAIAKGRNVSSRLAEFLQVIQQLLFPKTVKATLHISFGKSFTLLDINANENGRIMPEVITRGKGQLTAHLE